MLVPKESTRRRRKNNNAILRVPLGSVVDDNETCDPRAVHHHVAKGGGGGRLSRHDDDDNQQESFGRLFLRVAAVMAAVGLVVFGAIYYSSFHNVQSVEEEESSLAYTDDGMGNGDYHQEQQREHLPVRPIGQLRYDHQHHDQYDEAPASFTTVPPIAVETAPPLPQWNLSDYAKQYDAYAIAEQRRGQLDQVKEVHQEDLQNKNNKNWLFWQMAAGLRDEFASTYGGEIVARGMLDAASTNYGGGVLKTACRIQMARNNNNNRQQQRPVPVVSFVFGGYSVTAGRGNYFAQSFPLVMGEKLHSIFHEFGMELSVRNAAVGGCPSFPYGWCLENFWGSQWQQPTSSSPDAVSWDFSMNEAGGDPVGFEAYLRRILQVYSPHVPQLLMIDTAMALERRKILEAYGTHALVIHRDVAVEPFLKLDEKYRPVGFQNWRKFGAPIGAPGQSYHHPAVKEHEFIAWVLVMHFLAALELLMLSTETTPLECGTNDETPVRFTRPMTFANATATVSVVEGPSTSIFFGQSKDTSDGAWTMNPVHCRTSFDPILHGNLTDIVVAGGVGEDLDVMLPKSKMFYNQGWVLNLSEQEKTAKRSLNRFGGLGFVDSKRAYYGIFASGPISFQLSLHRSENKTESARANTLFRSIVVCEVNEKREHGACEIDRDIGFTVGGVNATKPLLLNHTQFLGKPVCVIVEIPVSAMASCVEDQCSLEVNATVVNRRINDRKDACSISHVIWEQQDSTNAKSSL